MWLAAAWLTLLGCIAAAGEWAPYVSDPRSTDARPYEPPSGRHLLGTDEIGRDVLSRLVYGARVSLPLAIAAVCIALVAGGLLGLAAGYLRRWVDGVIQWLLDVLISFPPLVTAMAAAAFLGRSMTNLALVLGLLFVPSVARLVRTHTMSLAEREFVVAARVLGARPGRIVARELVPSLAPYLSVYAVIALAGAIVIEGALSFLGLSVPPPSPTWGGMITAGRDYLVDAPHIALAPVTAMFLTILALNVLAEGLRRRLVSGADE